MNRKAIALLGAAGVIGLVALAERASNSGDASAVLCDFETAEELGLWEVISTELSKESEMGVSSGRHSGHVQIHPDKETSGILLKKPFAEGHAPRDWRKYSHLAFDLFNPGDLGRIIVRIKDKNGARFTTKLELQKRSANRLAIYLAEMEVDIDVRSVSQIQIYLWNPKQEYDLYIDHLRLSPPVDTSAEPSILDKQYLPADNDQTADQRSARAFAQVRARWIHEPTAAVRIPLHLDNAQRTPMATLPVSGGVPFPAGELRGDEKVTLVDGVGESVAAQFRPLGSWTDGSVKWLEVTTQMPLSGIDRETLYLEYGGRERDRKELPQLEVEESAEGVAVDTGPIKFEVLRAGFRLFDKVWLDQNLDGEFVAAELISSGSDLIVVFDGEEYRSSLDTNFELSVEQRGPLRAVLKAEGWFVAEGGDRFCRFIVRIHAFAGQESIKVLHTFLYTGYPQNADFYLYRGKALPRNEAPEAIRIDTALSLPESVSWEFRADGENVRLGSGESEVLQDAVDSYSAQSGGTQSKGGRRLDGWIEAKSRRRGVTVGIKRLWQQFPKGWGISSDGETLSTHLWPAAAGPLDLATTESAGGEDAAGRGSAFGLAKTHELTFRFDRGGEGSDRDPAATALSIAPTRLVVDPSWVSATLAVGRIRAFDPAIAASLERSAEAIFDWANRHVRDFNWYGMIDFGDTLSWYRERSGKYGWHPDGRWGWLNNEAMGLHSGALVQYLRTGRQDYFDFGESVALHIMDVDTVHYNTVANDSRLRGVIPDDFSRVGSQHRHNADHWGGRNEESSHTNLHGILLYYYMTGYDRALEVAREIGEFLLEGRVTYFGHPDNCPQRNIANVLWGLSELYEATGDRRYIEAAHEWADVLVKGQTEDGTWLEKYNPLSKRWRGKPKTIFTLQYTLPALIAYHRVTGNRAVGSVIVKATDYYIRERPYNPFFEALSYSYDLTGDRRYQKASREGIKYLLSKQRRGGGPMEDGMIFSKPTYLRPVEFLYQIPFAFEVLHQSGPSKSN